MFAVDLPVAAFYARFSARRASACRLACAAGPQDRIRQALAEMEPSTAGEIAEATQLDRAVVESALEQMTARCQVMFNPLTKRFSLPKLWHLREQAA